MKRILLTGLSGKGKSTVIAALGALGDKAVDADDGWCTTAPDGEWLWHEERLDQLLSTEDADVLFFGGCASNQGKFRHRFDHIVLLSAPLDVMFERLRTRTNNSLASGMTNAIALSMTAPTSSRFCAPHRVLRSTPLALSPTWSRTFFASPA